jgi:hypothetical protein
MKKNLVLLMFLLNTTLCYNQNMSVQETIDYINSITPSYLYHGWWSAPMSCFKSKNSSQRCYGAYYQYLKLEENGYISVMRHITFGNCTDNIDNGTTADFEMSRFHNNEVYVPYIKMNKENEITIRGKSNNKAFGDSYNNYSLEFCEFTDAYDGQRCLNALKYLFTTLQNDNKFSRNNQNDPFAPGNTTTQKTSNTSETTNKQSESGISQLNMFTAHCLAAPKKYYFQGENTSETLELRYKNPVNNITYYLNSYNLPPNTNVQYYLESYRNLQKNDGFITSEITYQGKKAIYGKLQIDTAYIYQLHFVNFNKGQTIQMLAGNPSEPEFERYKNEIKITK